MRYLASTTALLLAPACGGGTSATTLPDGPGACNATLGTLHSQVLPNGDGQEDRFYWMHVPANYACTPMPLLIDFHGTAGDQQSPPEEAYQTDALVAFSEARGVIVARPRSRSHDWMGYALYQWDANPGDLDRNVAFTDHLVASLATTYAIDPARVYASGFSSGSNMAAQFLSDPNSPFHGIAPIAGGDWNHSVQPDLAHGPRVYMSTGYRDYLWPFARRQIAAMQTSGLPNDRLEVRHTGGGHDLYPWHFDELWDFLDGGIRHGGGTLATPWQQAAVPSPADINALAADAGTLVAAGVHGRTWRLGSTGWTLDLDRGDADYTALCFGPNGRALVGGQDAAIVRTGATWGHTGTIPDYGGMFSSGWVNAASCRDDGSIVAVGYWSAAASSDGGTTWSHFDTPTIYAGVEAQMAGIATTSGGSTITGGYYDYVARAAAGAVTTVPIDHPLAPQWWNGVAAGPGGRFWVVGDGGSIVASTDDGRTWIAQASAATENLYAVHFADAQRGAAVGRRGTVVVTLDGGAHWTARPLGIDVYVGAVYVDAATVWIAGEDGLVASSPL
jgi:poly(3-hydroxybutyrate) depolymerase/photosystem II stability/assembly factor-like uncharacterized protein